MTSEGSSPHASRRRVRESVEKAELSDNRTEMVKTARAPSVVLGARRPPRRRETFESLVTGRGVREQGATLALNLKF